MEMEYNILVKKSTVCSLQVSHTALRMAKKNGGIDTERLTSFRKRIVSKFSLVYAFTLANFASASKVFRMICTLQVTSFRIFFRIYRMALNF